MSSKIAIDNILIRNQVGNFTDAIDLQITFSNLAPLQHAIEWKIIYFGSAEDENCDQTLQQFQIPPVDEVQTMKFELSCQPPDYTKVPREQLLCVTAMIITVSYNNQQFIRIGYYIHYQYCGDLLPQNLPSAPAHQVVRHTKRTILFDKPRVTKFNIKWDEVAVTLSESEREDRGSVVERGRIEEEEEEKLMGPNYEKLSTMEEKSSGSNNFDNQERTPMRIECE